VLILVTLVEMLLSPPPTQVSKSPSPAADFLFPQAAADFSFLTMKRNRKSQTQHFVASNIPGRKQTSNT
jgi:hypothetical protein